MTNTEGIAAIRECIDGLKERLNILAHPVEHRLLSDADRHLDALESDQIGEPVSMPAMPSYDAGLLSDHGGGDVEWWRDYLRAELGRSDQFYQEWYDNLRAHQKDRSGVLGVGNMMRQWDRAIQHFKKP